MSDLRSNIKEIRNRHRSKTRNVRKISAEKRKTKKQPSTRCFAETKKINAKYYLTQIHTYPVIKISSYEDHNLRKLPNVCQKNAAKLRCVQKNAKIETRSLLSYTPPNKQTTRKNNFRDQCYAALTYSEVKHEQPRNLKRKLGGNSHAWNCNGRNSRFAKTEDFFKSLAAKRKESHQVLIKFFNKKYGQQCSSPDLNEGLVSGKINLFNNQKHKQQYSPLDLETVFVSGKKSVFNKKYGQDGSSLDFQEFSVSEKRESWEESWYPRKLVMTFFNKNYGTALSRLASEDICVCPNEQKILADAETST